MVRKKMLVRLKEDGDSLVMSSVPLDEREMLVQTQPKIFYFTDHYRDYPMVQNLVMFIAVVAVSINFLVDLLYAVLDPRIKYADQD